MVVVAVVAVEDVSSCLINSADFPIVASLYSNVAAKQWIVELFSFPRELNVNFPGGSGVALRDVD